MEWPDKDAREIFEISGFIKAYTCLPGSPTFSIISKGDKPDFVVRERKTGEEFGVELTAVYLDDRSVPDMHMVDSDSPRDIPYDKEKMERYEERLISAISNKIKKARFGYDLSRPLILAIYVNEYIGIYLGPSELDSLVSRNQSFFDAMAPFHEVVFWSLPNGSVFCVRPG